MTGTLRRRGHRDTGDRCVIREAEIGVKLSQGQACLIHQARGEQGLILPESLQGEDNPDDTSI